MNEFSKDKPTSQQLVELLDNELDITICRDVVYGLDFEYKQLQQENQQLKDLEYKFIDDGEEYSFTLEEYFDMGDKLYNCEQQLDKYKSIIGEVRQYTNDKLFDDYTYCSYEDVKQNIEEILNKVGDVK